MFLLKNVVGFSTDFRFLKIDNIGLCLENNNMKIEKNEENLNYFKNEEESIWGRILNKLMIHYFTTMFEEVRHER